MLKGRCGQVGPTPCHSQSQDVCAHQVLLVQAQGLVIGTIFLVAISVSHAHRRGMLNVGQFLFKAKNRPVGRVHYNSLTACLHLPKANLLLVNYESQVQSYAISAGANGICHHFLSYKHTQAALSNKNKIFILFKGT